MTTFIKWLLRRRDQCSVFYSPFGVPGDTVDERAPPTTIVVDNFDDNHPDFMFMRVCHSQRAAVASAGFGMSFVMLMFISAFFEFDWYQYKRGVDLVALLTLFFYLAIGLLVHYYVILGVKRTSPNYLLPFIVVYMVVIGSEFIGGTFPLLHLNIRSFRMGSESRNVLIFALIIFMIVISVQATMLTAVCKCRVYLSRKRVHMTAMKVAQKSRAKNPGIEVVLSGGPVSNTASGVPGNNTASGVPEMDSVQTTTVTTTSSDRDAESQQERDHAHESEHMHKDDVARMDSQMKFASPSAQPAPYAAAESATYAYDQPQTSLEFGLPTDLQQPRQNADENLIETLDETEKKDEAKTA